MFKEHNKAWSNTEVVMTDKDMTERRVVAAAFPQANLHLCLFHTLRSFSREVTQEKLGVRDALLAISNAMANARSEEVCPAASATGYTSRSGWPATSHATSHLMSRQTIG